jgi:hypothetical protein
MAAGDRHAFRGVADWLEQFDEAAVGVYAARTGLPDAKLASMLDKETWISGATSVDQGFADELLDGASTSATSMASAQDDLTPLAAAKKLDIMLARQDITRSERRDLVAALKGGTSGAAPHGTHDAAVSAMAHSALEKLNQL